MSAIRALCAYYLLVLAASSSAFSEDLRSALSGEESQRVSDAVDRGLAWLAAQQNADGSFNGLADGVAVPSAEETSYVLLAFLSRGHQPGIGAYGRQISLAIEWLLSVQRPDGSFSTLPPEDFPLSESHPLSCLALSEAYGSIRGGRAMPVAEAIERALVFTRSVQASPKKLPIFRGSWHYARPDGLQFYQGIGVIRHTSWSLAFLRSASSSGFQVPQNWADEGLEFIVRCYSPGPHMDNFRRLPVKANQGVFRSRPMLPAGIIKEDLGVPSGGKYPYTWTNFNTTATGIWTLAMHGRRDDAMVRSAADWLADHSFPEQGTVADFYYSCYGSAQAMSQVGGEHWERFFPGVVRTLLPHQAHDGHWRLDRQWYNSISSSPFNTALAVLCLTLPDQMLPIHQR